MTLRRWGISFPRSCSIESAGSILARATARFSASGSPGDALPSAGSKRSVRPGLARFAGKKSRGQMNTITALPVSRSVPQAQTACARPIAVLLCSTDFLPGVGGVQQAVAQLAQGLLAAGNQPTVVTKTPAGTFDDRDLSYRVVRNPGFTHLWRLIGEADIVHLAGPAFIPLMIGLLRRKKIVIEHHGYQAICPNGLLLYAPRQNACPGHFLAGRYAECVRCVATASGTANGTQTAGRAPFGSCCSCFRGTGCVAGCPPTPPSAST